MRGAESTLGPTYSTLFIRDITRFAVQSLSRRSDCMWSSEFREYGPKRIKFGGHAKSSQQTLWFRIEKAALLELLKWVLTSGQKECSALGYAPLPHELASRQLQALNSFR